jgi:hypothetical protein
MPQQRRNRRSSTYDPNQLRLPLPPQPVSYAPSTPSRVAELLEAGLTTRDVPRTPIIPGRPPSQPFDWASMLDDIPLPIVRLRSTQAPSPPPFIHQRPTRAARIANNWSCLPGCSVCAETNRQAGFVSDGQS